MILHMSLTASCCVGVPKPQNKNTRQQILEAISNHQQATVDDIILFIQQHFQNFITPVTVRHHLHILEENELVTVAVSTTHLKPGRPKHSYQLTDKASRVLPRNYQRLADALLQRIAEPSSSPVNVIFEGIGSQLAGGTTFQSGSWENRLDGVLQHLNKQGYVASYERTYDGYILHTSNCPYHEIAQHNSHLCQIDMYYIATLLGVIPRRLSFLMDESERCSYFIPAS